ncbi:MAG: alpha/beta hydrolase family protein, partial [Promethearchaeota archaeon]
RDERKINGTLYHGNAAIKNLKKLVIINHGFSDLQVNSFPFAQALVQCGYHVFTWDYGGTGNSEGKNTNFPGHLEDLKEIIRYWFNERRDRHFQEIYLVGWSLGGMLSIIAGLDNEMIKKVFSWSTWSDLKRNVLRKIYWNPLALLRYFIKGQLVIMDKKTNKRISPVYYLRGLRERFASRDEFRTFLKERLFLCHSSDDKFVTIKNFRENNAVLELSPRNYHLFKKGDHLMIRNETMLLGLMIRFFQEGI